MEIPYGAWPSPLSAADVAATGIGLSWPTLAGDAGDEVWWCESRPAEGGRIAVVRRRADGEVEQVLPAPWNARTRLHEYGGRPFTVTGDGSLVFAHFPDQRLYRLTPGGEPTAITPAGDDRYAEPFPVGDEVWCVRERYADGDVTRKVVAVALDGSGTHEVAGTTRFLAAPTLSPDGRRLAWIGWDHPRMPWDGTTLYVQDVAGGEPRAILGGPEESVLQPTWRPDGSLVAITDRSGWWNLVTVDPADGAVVPLLSAEEEYAGPLWVTGLAWYALLDDGSILAAHGQTLSRLDPDGAVVDLDLPVAPGEQLQTDGRRVVLVGGSPTRPPTVLVVTADGSVDVVATAPEPPVGPEWLPVPERRTFPSEDGRVVHALVYPPRSPEVTGIGPAPYVVFVHGGPTASARSGLSLEKAYFTSRGIGVVDVDYAGSTGYGRAYRDSLRGQWGVYDVEDCAAAARGLVTSGEADGAALLIRGGSAGGWTVLAALTRTDTFAAGASYFGVADLTTFAEDTHDFESRYLDGLIGPLPESRALYDERSPITHVDGLSCPVLLLQGDEDAVVPPAQAEVFRDALVRKGIPHAYLLFAGEQHGFRKAENVIAALEAELSFYGQVLGFTPPGVPVLELDRP